MTGRELLALIVVAAPGAAALLVLLAPQRLVQAAGLAGGAAAGVAALVAAAVAVLQPADAHVGAWLVLDAAGGIVVGVVGLVGLGSTVVSPAFLGSHESDLVRAARAKRLYWASFHVFWLVLVAVPLAGNLGVAWLLLEATTAASALLVGWSGKRRALEAGWKYLLLTSLGLGFALLGIVMLASGGAGSLDALAWRELAAHAPERDVALVAYLLLIVGLAAKIGLAPVHNWLPDAHSEAPPPVSALLSGALLPAAALVAWRSADALGGVVGGATANSVLVGFGLVSLAVAVPFLWRPLAWKRLLAYSSLEHMGVIALAIGFASPLALAGVAVHVVGHAIAKALGFYAATPLLVHEPRAAGHFAAGVARSDRRLGAGMGLSLGALAGLPPSPLFVSEVLIVAGGFSAGRDWEAAVAAVLLALGFLGLGHALVETLAGKARRLHRRAAAPGARGIVVLTGVSAVLLLALAGGALWLPGSALADALVRGLT